MKNEFVDKYIGQGVNLSYDTGRHFDLFSFNQHAVSIGLSKRVFRRG